MVGFPNHTFYALLDVRNSSNALVAADSVPAVQVWHNNVVDASVVPTVLTTATTGVYAVSFTVPAGYSSYDQVALRGLYAVSGVNYNVQFDQLAILVPATALPASTSGFGAYPVTVLVTSDGTAPVAGAVVRINATGQNYVAISDGTGTASFSVSPATFTISATASGFGFAPISAVVDGSGNWPNGTTKETITLVPVSILPATDPSQTNAWGYTYDGHGNISPNMQVNFRLFNPNAPSNAYSRAMFSATSNSVGLLQIILIQSAKYEFQVQGDAAWQRFTAGASPVSQLPTLLSMKF